MDGDTPFLPRTLVENILKRLPAKSIVRFQSVSKPWKEIIKSKSFVEDHYIYYSGENPTPNLLLQVNYMYHALEVYKLSVQTETEISSVDNPPLRDSAGIIGSSHSLVCLEIKRHAASGPSHLLWNLTTREFKPLFSDTIYDSNRRIDSGFGFCPLLNDYKILTIGYKNNVRRAEVFSLSTGLWKETDCKLRKRLDSQYFSLNGDIFFLVLGEEVLISFNLEFELFTEMPLPASDCDEKKIAGYENKVAMIGVTEFGTGCSFVELWVKEEGTDATGESWNWTKKYKSRIYTSFFTPLTMWSNEIVCFRDVTESEEEEDKKNRLIVLINVSTNNSKSIDIKFASIKRAFSYVERMVPVSNLHTEEPQLSVHEEEEAAAPESEEPQF